MKKENGNGFETDADILIEEVDHTPENYEKFVDVIRVTTRKHILMGV